MPVPISLVIIVYNRERYLNAAIESVLAQTRRDFELLVWDDGSTDNSLIIAQNYAKRDRRIRVVAAKHQGLTPSLNAAIAQTSGNYIGSVDSDDILAPTALEETVAVLDTKPHVGWVYTDYLDIDQHNQVIGYGQRCHIPYSKQRLLVDFMTFHFRLIRRQVFEQVNGFDESCVHAQDYDLCLKLSEVAEVQHIKKPLYYYRSHQKNVTHQHTFKQAQDSCRAIAQAVKRRGLAESCQVSLEILSQSPFKSRVKIAVKKITSLVLATLPLAGVIATRPALAQSITSAGDVTNTNVTPNGNIYDINGGQLSKDGANLFHGFNKFSLDQNQTANFISHPSIQNILGRVNGGQPSVINGLIQVTGGNSNLYLMNPSGIIFGSNARLNVPADFTATTATSIGIGNNWFNAVGNNNYADLVGTPSSFVFNTSQPGVIINAGDLAVKSGKNLSLVGGTIINTGTAAAPQGNITMAAVPGESLVRISQPGHLLSLDVPTSATSSTQPGNWTLPIASLPQLLTGSGVQQATGISVNSNGQVILTISGTQIPSDTGTNIISGRLDTSGQTSGNVTVLGNKIGLVAANINASGDQGGGTILIGGDYQGKGTIPNASRTYISPDSLISADAKFNGNGGRVIAWADQSNEFWGKISARGGANSGDGGFVEVSGKEFLNFKGTVDTTAANGNTGTLLLDPTTLTIIDAAAGGGTQDATLLAGSSILFNDPDIGANTVSWGQINNLGSAANVVLQATGDITIDDITGVVSNGANDFVFLNLTTGSLNLTSSGGSIRFVDTNDAIVTQGGSVTLSALTGNITAGRILTVGGNGYNSGAIVLDAGGDITTGFINSSSSDGNAGNITITAGGSILASSFDSSFFSFGNLGNGGAIRLTAGGDITTTGISQRSSSNNGNGGLIDFTAGGNILTGGLNSSASGTGGAITLIAQNNINTRELVSSGGVAGGDITLTSQNGSINSSNTLFTDGVLFGGRVDASSINGIGGAITYTAPINITPAQVVITTNNNIRFNGSVTLPNPVPLPTPTPTFTPFPIPSPTPPSIQITTGPNTGNITFDGTVNGNAVLNLNTGTTGIVTLNKLVGGITPLTGLNISTSDIQVSGGVILADGIPQTYNSPVTLIGDAIFGSSGTPAITFNNTVAVNNNALTLKTNEINFNGGANSVTGSGTILIDPATPSQNIVIGGTGDTSALDLTTIDLDAFQNGFNLITIGGVDSSGIISVINPVTFKDPVKIQAPTGSGSIVSNGAIITGIDNASINLIANQNITTGNITSADQIVITSNNGGINTTAGILNSSASTNLTASQDITTGNITSANQIVITSNNSGINTTTGILNSLAATNLTANQSITTGSITAPGGIFITSRNGEINTTAGTLNSGSSGNGGTITLEASNDIIAGDIISNSLTNGRGGDINLISRNGAVLTNLLQSGGSDGDGGNIFVSARDRITTGAIISASRFGNGGNVTLDPLNDIQVSFINAQGGSGGRGGNVDITTARLFRATNTFIDQNNVNSSISTAGGIGGNVIIRHGGGGLGIPFDVGNALTRNGTAGAITTRSTNSILPVQSFPNSYTQDNIQIITQDRISDLTEIAKDLQGVITRSTQVEMSTGKVNLDTTFILRDRTIQALKTGQIDKAVLLLEQLRTQEFQNYFGGNLNVNTDETLSIDQVKTLLNDIAGKTGKTPAIIYVLSQPDQLELILVTPKGKLLLKTVYAADRVTLLKQVASFRADVTEPRKKTGYQTAAKQLYQWIIAPLQSELQAQKIDTLVFSMDSGLRSMPLAALYDGQQFLVEKYGIGLVPSLNLTDTRYQDVKNAEILAMGASKFTELDPLPAVAIELSKIAGNPNNITQNRGLVPTGESSVNTEGLWRGKSFLNQAFTLSNLKLQRAREPFGLIHLATHGEFNLGAPRNSFIQLWDTKLRLDQLRQLGWSNPPVELLVLSACRTALGNEDAEFGFGGLAVAAGVKSAVASLWYVSDGGTLGLMSEFYQQLRTAPIKAEALRLAQIAMIKGQVRIEGNQLQLSGASDAIPLPSELSQTNDKNFSHPYYWAAFTMIGSPW